MQEGDRGNAGEAPAQRVLVDAKGAQVDLTENQLTLATADKTLMFKRAD